MFKSNEIIICHLCYREHTFAPCARVLDLDSFVSRCLETTCTCLEAAAGSKEAEEKCRCLALQSFVVDCLTTNSDLEFIDWRMKYDCRKYLYVFIYSYNFIFKLSNRYL